MHPSVHLGPANQPSLVSMPNEVDAEGKTAPSALHVASGGSWLLTGQIAVLTVSFFATPFTLRLLGPLQYGLWVLVQTTMAYVELAEFGMSTASTRFGGDAIRNGDRNGEARAIQIASIASLSTVGLLCAVIAFTAPVTARLFDLPVALRNDGVTAMRLAMLATIARVVVAVVNTPLILRNRWRVLVCFTQGVAVIQVAITPLALVLHPSIVVVAALSAIASSCSLVFVLVSATRELPALRQRQSFAGIRDMLGYGASATAAGIANVPLGSAERFMLGATRSTGAVGAYGVAGTVAGLIGLVPSAVSQPLFSALSQAENESERRRIGRNVLRLSWVGGVILSALILAVASPLLVFWAGDELGPQADRALWVLVPGFLFAALAVVPTSFLFATSRVGELTRIRLLELPPFLVGAFLLTRHVGLTGAAIAFSARLAVDTTLLFRINRTRDGFRPFSGVLSRVEFTMVSLCAVTAVFARARLDGAVETLSIAVLAVGAIALVLGHTTAEERSAMGRVAASVRDRSRLRIGPRRALDI